jgi:hypothetical protein
MTIYSGEDYMDADGNISTSVIDTKVAEFAKRFATDDIDASKSNPSDVDVYVLAFDNTHKGTPNVVGTDGSTLIDVYGNNASSGSGSVMDGGIISKYVYSPSSDWKSALSESSGVYSLKTSGLNHNGSNNYSSYEQYAVNESMYDNYGFNIYLGNYDYATDSSGDNLVLTNMDYFTTTTGTFEHSNISYSNITFTIDVFKKWKGNYKTLQQSTALSFGLVNIINGSNDEQITVHKTKKNILTGQVINLDSSDLGHYDGDGGSTFSYGTTEAIKELYTTKSIGSRFGSVVDSASNNVNDNFFIIYTLPKRASDIVK